MLLTTLAVGAVTWGVLVPFIWLWFGCIYNKRYIKELIEDGYFVVVIHSERSREDLEAELGFKLK